MNPGDIRPGAEARSGTAGARLSVRIVGIVVGAVAVALAAQVALRLPMTVVPLTLQPLAVLVVGGVLGAGGGAAALVLYLAAGMAGLPVFAGGSGGLLHLLGPTGGYLLAFPVAAAATGWACGRAAGQAGGRGVAETLLACVLGMLIIHIGGVAQLAVLRGDPAAAVRVGFLPFFTNDLVKVGLAALLILAFRRRPRPIR